MKGVKQLANKLADDHPVGIVSAARIVALPGIIAVSWIPTGIAARVSTLSAFSFDPVASLHQTV